MTFGDAFPGLLGLMVAAAGWIGFKIVEHRRARPDQHIHTPAE